MKRFLVASLFALVGVAIGYATLSGAFMSPVDDMMFDEASAGMIQLMEEYPGYVPLSISPTSLSAVCKGPDKQVGYISPEIGGSGGWLNTQVQYNYYDVSLWSGIMYLVNTQLPAGSKVVISVSSDANIFYYGTSVNNTGLYQQLLCSYSTSKQSNASVGMSASNFRIYDGKRQFLQNLGTYTYGKTSVFEYFVEYDTDSFYLMFYNSHTANRNTVLYDSFYTAGLTISIDIILPTYYIPLIYQELVKTGDYVQHISINSDTIVQYLKDISVAAGTPSEIQKFEDAYLETQSQQLEQIESMLSPENTALPNGGDIASFVTDVQDGLGVSGSAFSSSQFNDALSAFSSSEATSAGGPWEFFTQAVADSLSGDSMTVGLNDDDYIYQWLEMMQGRYSSWSSSSP